MEEVPLEEIKKEWHGSMRAYVIGFILSIVLTLIAFFFVYQHALPKSVLIFIVLGLGFIQVVAQLIFFLHVGGESKPHWQTIVFSFMALVLLIVVMGSFWIMHNLNSRMMPKMIHTSQKVKGND